MAVLVRESGGFARAFADFTRELKAEGLGNETDPSAADDQDAFERRVEQWKNKLMEQMQQLSF